MIAASPSNEGQARTLVCEIHNNHSDQCGQPPGIVRKPGDGLYTGFFTNEYGEQWLVQIDVKEKTGVLLGGDLGWDEQVQLRDGRIVGDVILGPLERRWLDTCWLAATGGSLSAAYDLLFEEFDD